MPTYHKIFIGDAQKMGDVADNRVHLIITSPPYFNAPFDYKGLYETYDEYLEVLLLVAQECYRVLQSGRIFALNIDDMLVNGEKYPITADATKIFQKAGFRYRDRLIWKKPDGYVRISRRSGVLLQNPYPMYFYPDNLLESIIIFQKGRYDYKSVDKSIKELSRVDLQEFKQKKWFLTLWEMTNVLPSANFEKGIAAYPYELPYRLIQLFSHVGETVLDPFIGSGTTSLAALNLGRNSIGYDINENIIPIIKSKMGFDNLEKSTNGRDDKLVINYSME